MNKIEKEKKYIILYISVKNNMLKTFGTFLADNDDLAYEKAKSILPKFEEKVKIAMARLGEEWHDWLCNIEKLSYPVYEFGKTPLKPTIIKNREV